MKFIPPYKIIAQGETAPSDGAGYLTLTASSLAVEDATAAWAAGTYSVGAEVHLASTHRVYKCALAGSSTISPELDPTRWVDMRATNRWAAFDFYHNTKSSATTDLYFEFNTGGFYIDSAAIFKPICASIKIEVFNELSALIYSQTYPSLRDSIDYFDYFFGRLVYRDSVTDTGLPYGINYKIKVTFIGSGGSTRSVGTICIGQSQSIDGDTWGGTEWGAEITPISRTVNTVQDDGTVKIKQRGNYKVGKCTVSIPGQYMDIAVQLINDGLGTPCAWIPADYEHANELSIFGIVKDAPAKYENNGIGYISFNIEGLV